MRKFKNQLRSLFSSHPELQLPSGFLERLDKIIDENFEYMWAATTMNEFGMREYPEHVGKIVASEVAKKAADLLIQKVKYRQDPDTIRHQFLLSIWVYTGEDK